MFVFVVSFERKSIQNSVVFNDEVDSLELNNNHNKKIKNSYHNKSISAAAKGLFQGINPLERH